MKPTFTEFAGNVAAGIVAGGLAALALAAWERYLSVLWRLSPIAFLLLSFIALLAGALIGVAVGRVSARRKMARMGVSAEHIEELNRSIGDLSFRNEALENDNSELAKRPSIEEVDGLKSENACLKSRIYEAELDALEVRLTTLDFEAQLCALSAFDHRDDGGTLVIDGGEDGESDMCRNDPAWAAAEEAGFITMRPCGSDRSRAVPTDDCLRLLGERNGLRKQMKADLFNDMMRKRPKKRVLPNGQVITEIISTTPDCIIE